MFFLLGPRQNFRLQSPSAIADGGQGAPVLDLGRIELPHPGCKPGALPLCYRPLSWYGVNKPEALPLS